LRPILKALTMRTCSKYWVQKVRTSIRCNMN